MDLWADLRRDPGNLITEAIGRAVQARLGKIAKTVKSAGLDSVSIAGLKLDTSKIGKSDGATRPDALRALQEMAQAPVALIIDEAQHALTSESGGRDHGRAQVGPRSAQPPRPAGLARATESRISEGL